MSYWAIGASALTALVGTADAKSSAVKARDKAKEDEEFDALLAAQREQFAKTEGEGIGNVGEVRLSVDDEVDPDEELRRGETVRI